MPTATIAPTLPASISPTLAAAINATGFRWTLIDFKLANKTGHLQHRSDDTLHKPTVRRYVNQYRAGSIPPAIGVTQDGRVIWGNHRDAAAEAAGWTEIPAIEFQVNGADAEDDEFLRNSLISLAVAENAPHGLPYNPADRQEAAKSLLALGYTQTAVTKELGLSSSQVSGIKQEVDAVERLERLKAVTPATRSVQRAFAAPDARALNDEPFRQLADLATAANLTPPEVRQIAKEAKDTGSEAGAVATIAAARADMAQRIAEVSLGGTLRPTPVGKLRGVCKQVTDLCGSVTSPIIYRDHTGDPDTRAVIEAAINCLTGILAVQEDGDE